MVKFRVKNFLKNNYEFILSLFLLLIILIIAINPKNYISATFKGISIWAKIILPSLFCFFIFTKLLMQNASTIKIFNFLNKPFEKIFNTSKVGGYIYFMSCISGYPVGAKLISEFYEQGTITKDEAFRISCYASTSGPMFVIGSVGIAMFNNAKLGAIVLAVHLITALITGLCFRNFSFEKNKNNLWHKLKFIKRKKRLNNKCNNIKNINNDINSNNLKNKNENKINGLGQVKNIYQPTKQSLNDIMYNTIISVVMVGGYIALCFTILEVLNFLNILNFLGAAINKMLPPSANVGESVLKGILELTNGCVNLSNGNFSAKTLCVALSFLTSFGGFSIHLQSYLFLSKCGIKYKHFFMSKVLHSIMSVILSLAFSVILL